MVQRGWQIESIRSLKSVGGLENRFYGLKVEVLTTKVLAHGRVVLEFARIPFSLMIKGILANPTLLIQIGNRLGDLEPKRSPNRQHISSKSFCCWNVAAFSLKRISSSAETQPTCRFD